MTAPSAAGEILIRADGSAHIGGGHLMRCLTLADALRHRGATVSFVAASLPAGWEDRIVRSGHRCLRIDLADPKLLKGRDWDKYPWPPEAQSADAMAVLEACGSDRFDCLAVDHYGLDHHWEQALADAASTILVLDDLCNRRHRCDILLDHSLGRDGEEYRDLLPDHCQFLAVGRYGLLRPEFAQLRPRALARRRRGGPVRRLLVSTGSTDPSGLTLELTRSALAADLACAIDVIVPASGPSAEGMEALAACNPAIQVHVQTDRMAELMAAADLAVGAAGMTALERCCLGLPSLALVLAHNQEAGAAALERSGAVLLAAPEDDIAAALRALAFDVKRRWEMASAAARVTDGRGVERVAALLLDGAGADSANGRATGVSR